VGGQECRFFFGFRGRSGKAPGVGCLDAGAYVQIQAEDREIGGAIERRQVRTDGDAFIVPTVVSGELDGGSLHSLQRSRIARVPAAVRMNLRLYGRIACLVVLIVRL